MIHIKLINTHNENVNNILPNVTFCKAEQHIHYNPYIPPVPKLLDILYSDAEGNLYFSSEVLPVSDGKTPIALCIAPPNFFGDNEPARWMSLKYMNYTTPEIGSLSPQGMCWGNYGIDIESISNLRKVYQDGTSWGYHTADWIIGTQNKIPTLFDENNNWNISILGSVNEYAVTDIDGKNKTDKLITTANAQLNWRIDTTIDNSGGTNYAPAACCCVRYYTLGTNSNNWYLGAGGEMSIIVVKRNDINIKLSAINAIYPNDCIASLDNKEYWTSTEDTNNNAYNINTEDGGIGGNDKGTNKNVIALLQY